MPKAYGKEKKDALCAVYRENGGDVLDAAESVGVSRPWAYRVLKERGIFEPKHRPYPEEMAERACELYVEEKLSLVAVCERLEEEFGEKPSDTYVMYQMEKRGIERRDGGYERRGQRVFRYNGRRVRLRGQHGPDVAKEVLSGYEAGLSPRQLEEKHGVAVTTIEKWTTRAGIQRTASEAHAARQAREGVVTHVAAARLAERLYVEEEMSVGAVAEQLGRSHAAVIDYLEKRGVERRSRAEGLRIAKYGSLEAYRDFCRDAARLWHAEDWTKKAICEKHGVSYPTVRRALRSKHNPFRGGNGSDRAWLFEGSDTPAPGAGRSPQSMPSFQ